MLGKVHPIYTDPGAWMRFFAPVISGALIIWLIIYIMNFGGPRESLVARSESEFIRAALRRTVQSAGESSSKIITFSVNSDDLQVLPRAPSTFLEDAHISRYAQVLEYAARFNPKWIVVSWLSHAHPLNPEYLSPITSTIDRLNIHDRVTLALNFFATGNLEPSFVKRYNVVEARDCYHEVNIHCSFSPDWTWMPQQIMSRLLKNPESFVSTNLPHHLPNIILNLPNTSSLRNYRFMDVREPVAGKIPENALVFIGNNANQHVMFRDNKEVLQRTYVAQSSRSRSLQSDGIPWHMFWAAFSAMLIDSELIKVAPMSIDIAACIISALLILGFAFRKLDRLAFVTFLVLTTSLLVFNFFSVQNFNYYLPVTPIFITCFVTLTASLFLRLAINNYKNSRLVAVARRAEEAGDLKQNFLQLISHNLNTPIAQLRGLLELISQEEPDNDPLRRALLLSDFVRVTAKAALATNSLSGYSPITRPRSLKDLLEGFSDDESSFLERLGIDFMPGDRIEDFSSLSWQRLTSLDADLLANSVLYTTILIASEFPSSEVTISAVASPNADSDEELVYLSLTASQTNAHKRMIAPPKFMLDILNRYLDTAAASGRVTVHLGDHEALLAFKENKAT